MKLFLVTILFLVAVNGFTQPQQVTKTITANDYLQKSHSQKTFAWVLMATGVVTLGAGALITAYEGANTSGGGPVIIVAGIAMIGGSTLLFTSASHNKSKALKLNINKEAVFIPAGIKFNQQYYPSVSLKINL